MVRIQYLPFALLVGALAFAACGPGTAAAPAQGPTPPPPLASPTVAPAAVPSLQEFSNPDFGFSLSYPAGYELQSDFPHTFNFLAPQGTQGHRERASLSVELTFDQTAEWYANQAKEDNANLGIQITSLEQVIDGQQAYVLGPLPGQDLNRQVFIVKDGMLYHLRFAPDDPAVGEAYQQMEALYAAIMSSLRFLPAHQAVPPVTDRTNMLHLLELAIDARSRDELVRLLGDEFYLGEWAPGTPERVIKSLYGREDAAALILDTYVSQAPSVTLDAHPDWASVVGAADPFSAFFPDEVVTPVLVKGWGPNGADEAVFIIARRIDGSLFWRGAFVTQGAFKP